MNANDASIRINSDISLFADHKQIKGSNSELPLSTEEDGAVILRIKKNGAVSIRQLL